MIKEKFSDVQVKYVFIKSFEWINRTFAEVYSGHPHMGKVYRAVYNPFSKNWKLVIPGSIDMIDIMGFESLENSNEQFTSEIILLDKSNVTTLNLSEKSLDQIIKWNESGHKDIQEMYGERNEELPTTITFNFQALQDQQTQLRIAILESFEPLANINSIQLEILMKLARTLVQINVEESDDIKYNDNIGMGNNISAAIRDIQTYYSTDRRTNYDPDDLYCAMTHLIEEINRNVLNEE